LWYLFGVETFIQVLISFLKILCKNSTTGYGYKIISKLLTNELFYYLSYFFFNFFGNFDQDYPHIHLTVDNN